jgi:GR25 family glycosyltransferase involved in LPS biosynthesis
MSIGVYAVNLDSRPDRWEETSKECEKVGFNVVRIPGVDGQKLPESEVNRFMNSVHNNLGPETLRPGMAASKLGAHLAQINLLKRATEDDHDLTFMLEDDVVFVEGFSALLKARLPYIPENWEILTMGAIHWRKPIEVGGGVWRVRGCWSAHALLLTRTGRSRLLEAMEKMDAPIDETWRPFAEEGVFYALHPPLATQRAGHSDITGRWTDPYKEGRSFGV